MTGRIGAAIAMCAVVGFATACSAPAKPTAPNSGARTAVQPSPSATPLSFYAGQYVRIVAAVSTIAADIDKAHGSATPAQIIALIAAIQQADDGLARSSWPNTRIITDVQAMVRADRSVVGDLKSGTYGAQLTRDLAAGNAAVNIINTDLGLAARHR